MALKEEIDNYTDTIYAIVGFMNFYRYDDTKKAFKKDVSFFQGKKLFPSAGNSEFLTPDIGIVIAPDTGITGEVKNTLPRDPAHWEDAFTQVKKYDDALTGWPTEKKTITTHDVVLLVHKVISRGVVNYYKTNQEKFKFSRPFCIIEYDRMNQSKSKMFFRREFGELSNSEINTSLENGKPVPMDVFVKEYSMIKIYDAEPPLPYMISLIWENVIFIKASQNPNFSKLRKNQKIDVKVSLDEIVKELYEKFSFYPLCKGNSENQLMIPKKEWIKKACEKLTSIEEGKWIDYTKQEITVSFRRYDNVLEHFISQCESESNDSQTSLLLEEA